jgi:hypothetical protein
MEHQLKGCKTEGIYANLFLGMFRNQQILVSRQPSFLLVLLLARVEFCPLETRVDINYVGFNFSVSLCGCLSWAIPSGMGGTSLASALLPVTARHE